jgi:hypothetical protein
MSIQSLKNVGPYTWVSRDVTRTDNGHGSYRLIIYGAFNAYGLIGSELNGIAVFDENEKRVLCDEIARADSGYFGPSAQQLETLIDLVSMPWPQFARFMNEHPRTRYQLPTDPVATAIVARSGVPADRLIVSHIGG